MTIHPTEWHNYPDLKIVDGPHRLLNTAVDPIEPHTIHYPFTEVTEADVDRYVQMTPAQREAVERAFWKSVEILDAGGFDQDETWPPWNPALPANRQGPFALGISHKGGKTLLVTLDPIGIGNRRSNKSWLRE
jgi:hypothetical protein